MNKKYVNKCSKEVFLKYIESNNIDCTIKEIKGDDVIFFTNNLIDNIEIIRTNRIKYHLKYTLLKHLTGIITTILCICILLISGSFIRNIRFNDESLYNELVYQDVKSHLIKRGPFYVLNDTPNNISRELRQKYPEYAWIGITVNYSEIVIDIERQDVPIKDEIINNRPSDLISKYDAVITGIIVKSGVVMVMINQSVKKGDLLVSGNLLIENNGFDKERLVTSVGVVIGKTLELKKIIVNKKEESLGYTGRVKSIKKVFLFGKNIGKNHSTFDIYFTKITPVFNLFNIFKIIDITYYEQDVITSFYDRDSAVKFAESKIYHDFEMDRTSNLESIDNIKVLDVLETSDYFEISFIVTKHINIVMNRYYDE